MDFANKDNKHLKVSALFRARELPPSQLSALKEAITARNLGRQYIAAIDVQLVPMEPERLLELVRYLRRQRCPVCRTSGSSLQGGIVQRVVSLGVITERKVTGFIACQDCLRKRQAKSILTTVFLGWWGFPWGLIYTPQALYRHFMSYSNSTELSDSILADFALQNAGYLVGMGDKPDYIEQYLKEQNRKGTIGLGIH